MRTRTKMDLGRYIAEAHPGKPSEHVEERDAAEVEETVPSAVPETRA